VLSTEATRVSFDGSDQLTVDFKSLHDTEMASRTSEVDDVSLRMRTTHSSAHLLTSSSRHVTSDLLTLTLVEGRISANIRTASGMKVCS